MGDCTRCRLHKTARTVKVASRGADKPIILFVGEAPGRNEDTKGEAFVGEAWEELKGLMKTAEIDHAWCRWTNVVRCVPLKDPRYRSKGVRPPEPEEIEACRPYIEAEVLRTRPVYVVPLGGSAAKFFIPDAKAISGVRGKRWVTEFPSIDFRFGKLLKWLKATDHMDLLPKDTHTIGQRKKALEKGEKHGFPTMVTRKFTVWPTFHPSYVLHGGGDEARQYIIEDLSYLRKKITGKDDVPWDKYVLLDSLDKIKSVYSKIKKTYAAGLTDSLALDVETTGLHSFLLPYGELLLFSISDRPGRAYTIPFNHPESPFWKDEMSLMAIVHMTNDLLDVVPLVGHNLKFDIHWLNRFGIHPKYVAGDTYLAHWSLFNDMGEKNLETLATRYLGMISHKDEMVQALLDLPPWLPMEKQYEKLTLELTGNMSKLTDKKHNPWAIEVDADNVIYRERHMGDLDLFLVHKYCCADADTTGRLHTKLCGMLDKDKLLIPHNNYTVAAILPTVEMERKGIRLDLARFAQAHKQLQLDIDEVQKWFDEEYADEVRDRLARMPDVKKVPKEVKLSSTRNKRVWLFDMLKCPIMRTTDSGAPSADKEVLEDILLQLYGKRDKAKKDSAKIEVEQKIACIKKLQKYNTSHKLVGSFIKPIPKYADLAGIAHAQFGIGTTETQRYNCKGVPPWHGITRGSITKECVVPIEELGLILIADWCVVGDTKVISIDGVVTMKEIVESFINGEEPAVLSCGPNGELEFKRIVNGAPVAIADTVELETEDGSKVKCTKGHKWMRLNGEMAKIQELKPGDRLMHVKEGYGGSKNPYPTFYAKSAINYKYQHKLTSEYLFGLTPDGYQTDHKDGNKYNWVRSNIRLLPEAINKGQGTQRWWDKATEEERKDKVKALRNGFSAKVSMKGVNNPNYGNLKGKHSVCLCCGDAFYASPSKKRKYCSHSCYVNYTKKPDTITTCEVCRVEIRDCRRRVTCSPECKHKLFVLRQAGSNHRVKYIRRAGREWVYQITVDGGWHTYVLENGLVSGNSQQELRVLANYCGDEEMIKAFREGRDIHTLVTAMCQGKRESDVTKADRNSHKAVSLGVAIGGRGSAAVASQLGISKDKAKDVIKKYLDTFPSVRKYHKKQEKLAQQNGEVWSEWGFRRLLDKKKYDKDDLRRRGINNPIQMCRHPESPIVTAAGVFKMRELYECQHGQFSNGDYPPIMSYFGQSDEYRVLRFDGIDFLEVETSYGSDLVSSHHMYFTYEDKDLKPTKLLELKQGDLIAAQPVVYEHERCNTPTWATEQVAELFGILAGDGSYSSNRTIQVAAGDDLEFALHCCDLMEKVTGGDVDLCNSNGYWIPTVHSKDVRQRLKSMGLPEGETGAAKRVPGWVMRSEWKIRAAYLRGMYDSDGGVAGYGVPCFTNVSPHLAAGFQWLVHSLGMLCRKTRYSHGELTAGQDFFKVWIPSEFADDFIEVVKPSIERKRDIRGHGGWPNMPKQLVKDVADAVLKVRKRFKSRFSHAEHCHLLRMVKGSGSRWACLKFLEKAISIDPNWSALYNLYDLTSIYWAEIRSVSETEFKNHESFDIEVLNSKDHSYVASGLLQHNSAAIICTNALIMVTDRIQREKLKSSVWATVHDSLCSSIYPGELWQYATMLEEVMVDWPAENLDWLNVPLAVDFDIGVSWGETLKMVLLADGLVKIVGEASRFSKLKRVLLAWDARIIEAKVVDGEDDDGNPVKVVEAIWDLPQRSNSE